MISQYLAWTILTLVFIAGCDQLYAMDPVIPLKQRQPSRKFRTNNQTNKTVTIDQKATSITNCTKLMFNNPFLQRLKGGLGIAIWLGHFFPSRTRIFRWGSLSLVCHGSYIYRVLKNKADFAASRKTVGWGRGGFRRRPVPPLVVAPLSFRSCLFPLLKRKTKTLKRVLFNKFIYLFFK